MIYYQRAKNYCLKFLRKLHLNWHLSLVKTVVARNKFPYAKVARSTK